MVNEKSNQIRLGVFVTLGTLLLIFTMYFVGEKQNLFGDTFVIKARFNNLNGLQKGNNVRFSGIDVGTVKKITILNDSTIEVMMVVEEKVHEFIKEDAIATIGTDGLMGNKLINISPGKSSGTVIPDGGLLASVNLKNADDMLRRLEETNNNIAVITESLVDIINKVNQEEGALGKLIGDSTLAASISETMFKIREISERTAGIAKSVEATIAQVHLGEGTLGALLRDTTVGKSISKTVGDIEQIGKNTEEITRELQGLILSVRQGEGSVGALLTDSVFAVKLENSLHNLEEGSKAFGENMEALKRNILFRGYFRKQARKQANEEK